jgi:hypothetical protein
MHTERFGEWDVLQPTAFALSDLPNDCIGADDLERIVGQTPNFAAAVRQLESKTLDGNQASSEL